MMVKIGEIADFKRGPFGSSVKKSVCVDKGINTFKLYEQGNVINNDFDRGTYYLTQEKFEQLSAFEIKSNDLLITCAGTLGKIAIVPKEFEKGIFNSVLMRIRVNDKKVLLKYFYYYFQSPIIQNNISSQSAGVAIKNLFSTKKLKEYKIYLPSLNEQQQIVEEIENQLTRVEDSIKSLSKVKEKLSTYRQSILKNAFEGRYTEQFRNIDDKINFSYLDNKIEKNKKINTTSQKPYYKILKSLIPSSWHILSIRELSQFVTSGSRNWSKYYSDEGAIFVRTQNINTNILNLDNVARVKLPEKVEGKRTLITLGDILVTITGANVGKVAVIEKEIEESYVSQSVALIKAQIPEISKFIQLNLMTPMFGKTQLDKMVYGIGRPILSLENIRDVLIPLPSIDEINNIVEEIESRFSVIEKVEQTVEASLKKAEQLKKSILKSAFEGKLIKQPVEVLNK